MQSSARGGGEDLQICSGTAHRCWVSSPLVGICRSIIVLQHYAGASSLYIQEGRQDKGPKTAPRAVARGLSHVRTLIILTLPLVRKMQRNTRENEKGETKESDEKQNPQMPR